MHWVKKERATEAARSEVGELVFESLEAPDAKGLEGALVHVGAELVDPELVFGTDEELILLAGQSVTDVPTELRLAEDPILLRSEDIRCIARVFDVAFDAEQLVCDLEGIGPRDVGLPAVLLGDVAVVDEGGELRAQEGEAGVAQSM